MSNQIVQGTLTAFGHAPYKDDEKNQASFYVEIETATGKNKFWGLGLEQPLKSNNLSVGDNIALLDKGLIEGTKKREWDIEKYTAPIEYKNNIENANKEQLKDKKDQPLDFKKDNLKGELDLPESIKNNYTAIVRNRLFKDETINFYERDDKNNTVIAFEDRKDSINTSRSDEKTIKAMLDIAVSKNWASVSLKGTEEFKQKAWLEASIRGIETKGYVPSEKDLAELKIAQQERTSNAIQYEASVKPEIKADEKNLGEDKPKENELNKDIEKEKPSLSLDQLKTVQDVRNYIGKVIATGLENGTINNRDTLIDSLKKEGLTVVKEVNKSISIENPIGSRNIRLQGEVFEKGFNALDLEKEKLDKLITSYKDEVSLDAAQTIGVNKNSGINTLKVTLDEYKDKLSDKDKINIEAFSRIIEFKFKDNPTQIDKKLNDLAEKVPDIAMGKYQLPEPPTLKQNMDINVQVSKQGDQERGR